MDAPTSSRTRREERRKLFARFVVVLLGALLALGAWQGYGVLLYGIEGSYAH